MKKILSVCEVALILFCLFACNGKHEQIREDYLCKINSILKEYEFDTAKVENDKIILYNSDNEIVEQLMSEDYRKDVSFMYARKNGAIIYYIISAAVDDEQGIIFINDDSNGILDGINSITRIGGNSYYYSTN